MLHKKKNYSIIWLPCRVCVCSVCVCVFHFHKISIQFTFISLHLHFNFQFNSSSPFNSQKPYNCISITSIPFPVNPFLSFTYWHDNQCKIKLTIKILLQMNHTNVKCVYKTSLVAGMSLLYSRAWFHRYTNCTQCIWFIAFPMRFAVVRSTHNVGSNNNKINCKHATI